MKTKNVRVRTSDIKHGKIIYVSHPFYGIEKLTVTSKPYFNKLTRSLFFNARTDYGECKRSINDAGISDGDSYNSRRSFVKEKQAIEWKKKMSKDSDVISQHIRHEQMCAEMDVIYDDYI